ncbi:MAG: hypothetical protein Alis3KO_17730 [Aliiglaciecola sp.]
MDNKNTPLSSLSNRSKTPYFLDSKKSAESNLIQNLKEYSPAISIVLTAIGVLIWLSYFSEIGHVPRGLTIGDGLMFIVVALGYGSLYLAVSLLLFSMGVFIVNTIAWPLGLCLGVYNEHSKIDWYEKRKPYFRFNRDYLSLHVVGALLLFVSILLFESNPPLLLNIFATAICMSIIYLIFDHRRAEPKNKKSTANKNKWIYPVTILSIPIFIGKFHGTLVDTTMVMMGIKKTDAIVKFDSDYGRFVAEVLPGYAKKSYKTTVLLSSIGDTSILEIGGFRFVVPNSQYQLVYRSE